MPQGHDNERTNSERPQVKMIVGWQGARGTVRGTGHEENLRLGNDPLHTGPSEKLRDDSAGRQRTPNRHALAPVTGGQHEESAVERQLINETRHHLSKAILESCGRDLAEPGAELLRDSLDIEWAIVTPWKCRDAHDSTLRRDQNCARPESRRALPPSIFHKWEGWKTND